MTNYLFCLNKFYNSQLIFYCTILFIVVKQIENVKPSNIFFDKTELLLPLMEEFEGTPTYDIG